eukprot:3348207-Rhodomonas_salina.1
MAVPRWPVSGERYAMAVPMSVPHSRRYRSTSYHNILYLDGLPYERHTLAYHTPYAMAVPRTTHHTLAQYRTPYAMAVPFAIHHTL